MQIPKYQYNEEVIFLTQEYSIDADCKYSTYKAGVIVKRFYGISLIGRDITPMYEVQYQPRYTQHAQSVLIAEDLIIKPGVGSSVEEALTSLQKTLITK